MTRFALSAALLLAAAGSAMAASPAEPTNSATASQLALEVRACNQLDDATQRDACKTNARNEHVYKVRVPFRDYGRFERQYR